MKKILLAASLVSMFVAANVMADVTATATASWDATAIKDTKSMLVVTALNSLNFQYAEGLKGFNSQDGAFDVTIQGQEKANDFELKAKIVNNILTNVSDDPSTLNVGVAWNGKALSSSTDTLLVNTTTTSGLENLINGFNSKDRVSDRSNFKFTIVSATKNGTEEIKFSDLPDGYWHGDVKVQFNATWKVTEA